MKFRFLKTWWLLVAVCVMCLTSPVCVAAAETATGTIEPERLLVGHELTAEEAATLRAMPQQARSFAPDSLTRFFGPIPYLSRADIPFSPKAAGYFVEDIEDGQFNPPGVTLGTVNVPGSFIVRPSYNTDSVDGDDGVIDGFGRAVIVSGSGPVTPR